MGLYYDFEFSSARVIIITISFVWGSLVIFSLVEESFTDLFSYFPTEGDLSTILLVWGGSPPLSFVAAVAAATATTAAAYVVVEAAIGFILASV